MGLIVALIIGALCGMFAGMIVKGHGFGCLGNVVVGVVGSLLFGWLFGNFDILGDGVVSEIVGGTLGAIGLLLVIGLFSKAV
jgi:uncharacterized membrane protein YeaQ/YmgE (transglycosylase-associated protein family)